LVSTPPPESSAQLDSETRTFTEFLASVCRDTGLLVPGVLKSGNITDGPGWIFEATDEDGFTFNVEVAGPAFEPESGRGAPARD
jgi:hypothetical protein